MPRGSRSRTSRVAPPASRAPQMRAAPRPAPTAQPPAMAPPSAVGSPAAAPQQPGLMRGFDQVANSYISHCYCGECLPPRIRELALLTLITKLSK
ncbi:TPA: hypothetical protein BOS_6517 [Bos taurus]|nr:TPA: hypothetical protein BOS_6517 [Bos taurus]